MGANSEDPDQTSDAQGLHDLHYIYENMGEMQIKIKTDTSYMVKWTCPKPIGHYHGWVNKIKNLYES